MRSINLYSKRLNLRTFLLTLTCVGMICYFCYHIVSGGRGVIAYFKLSSEHSSLQSEFELARSERINLEHRSNLLKSESLDLDLLEQQAKMNLGYAKPHEMVLIEDE